MKPKTAWTNCVIEYSDDTDWQRLISKIRREMDLEVKRFE